LIFKSVRIVHVISGDTSISGQSHTTTTPVSTTVASIIQTAPATFISAPTQLSVSAVPPIVISELGSSTIASRALSQSSTAMQSPVQFTNPTATLPSTSYPPPPRLPIRSLQGPTAAGWSPRIPITTCTGSFNTREELASLFHFKYQPAAKGKRAVSSYTIPKKKVLQTWNHPFVALANSKQEVPPDASQRAKLQLAGLGERKVTLYIGGDARDVHDDLIAHFPKLAGAGGFELLTNLGKKLDILPCPENGYTVDYLKAVVRHSKIFIRPIQQDLMLDEVKEEVCLKL